MYVYVGPTSLPVRHRGAVVSDFQLSRRGRHEHQRQRILRRTADEIARMQDAVQPMHHAVVRTSVAEQRLIGELVGLVASVSVSMRYNGDEKYDVILLIVIWIWINYGGSGYTTTVQRAGYGSGLND